MKVKSSTTDTPFRFSNLFAHTSEVDMTAMLTLLQKGN